MSVLNTLRANKQKQGRSEILVVEQTKFPLNKFVANVSLIINRFEYRILAKVRILLLHLKFFRSRSG